MARKGEVSILLKIRDGGSAALAATQTRLKKFAGDVKGYFTSVNGALATLTAGVTAASIGAFVVRSTMEFQRFSAQLGIFSGSAAKANAVMHQLKQLAMDLPFDLAQITEAFITLRSGGIDPSEQTFRRLGDVAAGMGKDIGTLAQAVKNGVMGEMEMLKQFGFSMIVQGDQLRASFGNTTKLIGRDAGSILGFLEEIAQKEFAGAAAARMQTLEGAFSNLQDKAWNLAVAIGQRGGVAQALVDAADVASDFFDFLGRQESKINRVTSVLIALAKVVGGSLKAAFTLPLAGVGIVVGTIQGALGLLLTPLAMVGNLLGRIISVVPGLRTVGRELVEFTDPAKIIEFANNGFARAGNAASYGGDQLGQISQRWWDVRGAMVDPVADGFVNVGALAKRTKTPGGGGTKETVADYNKRQLEIAKAQIEREERQRRAGAGGATSAAVDVFERRLTRGIGSNVVNNAGMPTAAELKKMNDEITASIKQMRLLGVEAPSTWDKIAAGLQQAANDAGTLNENLVEVGQTGLADMVGGMTSAFGQIREGWDEVGRAMSNAVAGAVANMAAAMSRYYALQAAAAFAEGIKEPLLAGAKFAAAARLFAASAGFAALSGVLGAGGSRGGAGAGAGGRGRGAGTNGLDDATGAPLTLVLNGDRFDLNDPRTQDEFRQMLERLAGRAVVIRSR